MADMGDTLRPVVAERIVEIRCFCGKRIVIGYHESQLCMAHDVPPCERFMRDEPGEKFLRALHCYHRGWS